MLPNITSRAGIFMPDDMLFQYSGYLQCITTTHIQVFEDIGRETVDPVLGEV